MMGSGRLLQVYATLAVSLLVSAAGVYFNLLTGEQAMPVIRVCGSANKVRMTSHASDTLHRKPFVQGWEVSSA